MHRQEFAYVPGLGFVCVTVGRGVPLTGVVVGAADDCCACSSALTWVWIMSRAQLTSLLRVAD